MSGHHASILARTLDDSFVVSIEVMRQRAAAAPRADTL